MGAAGGAECEITTPAAVSSGARPRSEGPAAAVYPTRQQSHTSRGGAPQRRGAPEASDLCRSSSPRAVQLRSVQRRGAVRHGMWWFSVLTPALPSWVPRERDRVRDGCSLLSVAGSLVGGKPPTTPRPSCLRQWQGVAPKDSSAGTTSNTRILCAAGQGGKRSTPAAVSPGALTRVEQAKRRVCATHAPASWPRSRPVGAPEATLRPRRRRDAPGCSAQLVQRRGAERHGSGESAHDARHSQRGCLRSVIEYARLLPVVGRRLPRRG